MTRALSLPTLRRVGEVQTTRGRVAEKRLQEQRAVCNAIREEADGHRREIGLIRERLEVLIGSGEASTGSTDAERLQRPQAYRYWIHFDLEREEYYLQQTMEQLAEAENELADRRRAWLVARSRAENMSDRIRLERSLIERAREARQELEGEDLLASARGRDV